MRYIRQSILLFLITVSASFGATSVSIQGRVLETLPEDRSFKVKLTESTNSELPVDDTMNFRVGAGDLAIGYEGRKIRAKGVYYNNAWHLERVFPIDGIGSKAMTDINQQLHDLVASMSRRSYLKTGDYVPNFSMIDQQGNFLQIRELRGKSFVLNFIFTRCKVAKMCPASTMRMAELQEMARANGLENLHFVTVTFDPEFDSPGILRTYAENYGIEHDNFHLLTSTEKLTDDLLRLFGILTVEEDGTINHTMATLLIDANGRIAFRKEGSTWNVEDFLEKAKEL